MTLTDVGTFCDRCADRHVSALTGFPMLPDPPEPLMFAGADGRRHRLRFRLWRAPTGVSVELEEVGVRGDGGYRFAVLGDHDADVEMLIAAVQLQAEEELAAVYLEPAAHRDGWVVAGDEVAGRFVFNPDPGPHRIVVDGRVLSWEELGVALESFEGWRFRLIIEDPGEDLRPDADVVALPTADRRMHPSSDIE
jgi:hypothetical protein